MKSNSARKLQQVLFSRGVVSALALLVVGAAVAHGAGRGGGGGGGVSRGGVASTGSFAGGSGAARQVNHPVAAARIADNRRDIVDNGHRDHPVAAAAVAARAVDNRRDYGGGGGAYYAELPCSSSETYVDGVTYYACGTTYYVQSYSGGSVVYVPSPPPPGY